MPKDTLISKITKEDPPSPRQQRYDWADIAEQLKADPGQWHKIFDRDKTSYSTAIRNGDIAALRKEDGFEQRTSNNTRGREATATEPAEPRMCALYLKYVKPKRTTKRKAKT